MRQAQAAVLALTRLAAVRDALELLTTGDVQEAGRKAHLLAWLLRCSPFATQKELAAKLGVTPGRVCQMLRVLNRRYGQRS
jgi:DNA-binding MarR family transcriptional regulator